MNILQKSCHGVNKFINPRAAFFVIMGRDPVEFAKRAKHKPPAMWERGEYYTKNCLSIYSKVAQADYKRKERQF